MRIIGFFLLAAAGCSSATVVDVEPVPADYTDWYRLDVTGAVPGHGDTYRIIYANDVARLFGTIQGTPPDDLEYVYRYPQGSIIVKEIHELDGDQPGDIKYLGVMRMLDRLDVPDGAELAQTTEAKSYGWLFTYLADDIDSDEEYRASCWDECHVASPYGGAFYDYGE
jgi:hypothetical protein